MYIKLAPLLAFTFWSTYWTIFTAQHGLICRSYPSHELKEVWDIDMFFSSPRVSKINFLIHVLESFFTTAVMSLSVVFSARVKPSYRIRLNPCLPSLAQRSASCQYDRIDFGQPMWTTSCATRISNPIPKATVAIIHRIRFNTIQAYVVNKPSQWHFVFRTFSF